ncbi:hypothetical protein FCV66_13325 [Enterovibrio norvegicus]|uniref:hypothetical protein n=1 Tax=Enterovibrio norvegicus TaxID=188144 RepID=UPI0010BE3E30|nr:hypothetical protein [Enterovibrio norvegicus]TKF13600.1 hypothetical protein FCV66_13325 [Enterovibrio norvegicus]
MNFDLFWPTIKMPSEDKINEKINIDIRKIKGQHSSTNSQVILDEARRLYDQEQDRRSTADNKAGIYIASIAALLSIILSLIPTIINANQHFAINVINVLVFTMAIMNLLRAAIWAKKVISVSSFHLIHWGDLLSAHNNIDIENYLVKKLLCALRANYDLINNKVTSIKMTHALLVSACFWFLIIIIIRILSHFSSMLFDFSINPSGNNPMIYICYFCNDYA